MQIYVWNFLPFLGGNVYIMKRVGFDIGSTTVKAAVVGENNELLFSRYQRYPIP